METKNASELFISYALGGESEEMVNKIYSVLIEKQFNVIRSKIDLDYKDSIKQFIERLGAGKAIVIVISDSYLKSEDCMIEMIEIHKNKNVWNRIFPIVLPDALIYDEMDRIDYLNYWDEKGDALKNKIKTIKNPVGTEKVIAKINQYFDIRRLMDEILDMLRDMNTLTPQLHEVCGFQPLIEAVEKQFQNDKFTMDEPEKNVSHSNSANVTGNGNIVLQDLKAERIDVHIHHL